MTTIKTQAEPEAFPEPKVSVVLATYNGAKYIREQLDSLLNQSYTNYEIIICDDQSTDDTTKIIKPYLCDPRIKLHLNEKRLGINGSFELGTKLSSGQYISYCDQDDIWQKDKLSIHINNFHHYTLVYSSSKLVDENGFELKKDIKSHFKIKTFENGRNPLFFLNKNCVSGHAMTISADLKQHILPFPKFTIYDQWIALVASCLGDIHFINQELTRHRLHGNNAVSDEISRKKQRAQQSLREKPTKSEKRLKTNLMRKELVHRMLANVDSLTDTEQKLAGEYYYQLEKFETTYFNPKLFYLLLSNKSLFFKETYSKSVKKSLRQSIGLKWYELLGHD